MRNTPLTRAICKVGVAILARSGVPLPGHAGAPPDKITYILDWFPPGEATFPSAAPHEGLFAKEGPDVTGPDPRTRSPRPRLAACGPAAAH